MKLQLQQDIFEQFGENDMTYKKDYVVLNRHVRLPDIGESDNIVSSKGGITFHIHINQLQQTLTYTWAQCHPDDNFCRKLGAKIAEQRFKGLSKADRPNDLIQVIVYDRSLSLIGNIVMDLHYQYNNKIGKTWSKELHTMYTTLRNVV